MVSENDNDIIDVLWGAEAIGAAIGANRRRAFHMLESGQLPAKRIGGRWCARRSELLAALSSSPQVAS